VPGVCGMCGVCTVRGGYVCGVCVLGTISVCCVEGSTTANAGTFYFQWFERSIRPGEAL